MSLRQFSRAFRAQTSTTPARVVERLRADLARGRIETTAEPVERIAEAVGFGDAENMRRAFIRIYDSHPNRSGAQLKVRSATAERHETHFFFGPVERVRPIFWRVSSTPISIRTCHGLPR